MKITPWEDHIKKLNKKDSLDYEDKQWRLQNLYPISHKTGQLISFQFNIHQHRLAEFIEENVGNRDFDPILVLKARQVGISTLCCLWFLDDILHNSGRNAVVQSYQHDSKDVIFRVIRLAYDLMYPIYKHTFIDKLHPSVSSDSIEIQKSNSRIESQIQVRSQAVNMMLFSEYALMKWLNIVATLGSLTPECLQVYESTSQGKNHFHKRWNIAKDVDITGTHCLFIGWHEHEEYKAPVISTGLGDLDEKEEILKKDYQVTDEQLQWRRNKKAEMSLSDDHNSFEMEFPANDIECFQSSGSALLDLILLNELEQQVKNTTPIKRYWLKDKKAEEKTLVKIYRTYSKEEIKKIQKTGNYFSFFAGVDPAEGIGRDFSSCVVISVNHLQQVEILATLRGYTDPTLFANHINVVLKKYYSYTTIEDEPMLPYTVVERNNHGHAVLALLDPYYDNLYEHSDHRLGFPSTLITRKQIMLNLFNLLRVKNIKINDPVIIKELNTLTINRDNGKIEAEAGEHDDTILALALAIQGYYIDNENFLPEKEPLPKKYEEPDDIDFFP